MAVFEISSKDYEIIASIMKDGPGMRRPFTFKDLLYTLKSLGFAPESKGRLSYNGKVLLVFRPGDKGRIAVPSARQDELKRQMYAVFGWTKGSFVERSGV